MNRKYVFYYITAAIALVGAVALALCTGSVKMNIEDLITGFSGKSETMHTILVKIRLPRVLGAILTGAALAAAGCVLQSVTGNRLCAPNIIGVNAGAGLGVILVLCLYPSLWQIVPLTAFLGALAASGIVMGTAFFGGGKTSGTTIVLSGVAVSAILNAGISFLSLRFPDVLSSYTAFSIGGFASLSFKRIFLPAVIIAVCLVLLQMMSKDINTLCLGDEIAQSLGVNVKKTRLVALIFSAALCGASVSFAGLFGFVGLIVPNLVRDMCGNDTRYNISLSTLFGAGLTVLSDWAGRFFFAPTELPAGIIMSLIGAPFFLYILVKGRIRYA